MRKPLTDEQKARHAERQRAYRADPEVKARRAERKRAYQADPDVKARRAERQRARNADPEAKAMRRDRWLRGKYGITLDEYATMVERQSGKCASCERPLQRWGSAGARAPVVDHCHSTDDARGSVRGILHNSCNVLIGLAQDDAELLRRAARYVERTRAVRPYAPGPEQATLALPGVPSKPRKKGT